MKIFLQDQRQEYKLMEHSLVYIIKTSGIHEEEEDGKNNYTSILSTK